MPKLKLQPRERSVVMIGGIALVAIIIYWAFQGPYDAYMNSKNQLKASRMRLQQARVWQAEIDASRKQQQQIREVMAKSNPGFDLWTHVDQAVKDAQLAGRAQVQSLRAGVASQAMTAVTLDLSGVSTKELVDVLHRVYESDSFVVLQRLDELKPSTRGKGLDCKMVFAAPKA